MARIGAGLQHPNVIAVFDVVVEDGEDGDRWSRPTYDFVKDVVRRSGREPR